MEDLDFFSKHVRFTAGHNKFLSGIEQLWSSGLQIRGGAIWELVSCDDRILVSLFRISVLYLFADRDLCILVECMRVRVRCSEASADMFIGCRTEGGGRCSWTNSRRCEFHSRPLCRLLTCAEWLWFLRSHTWGGAILELITSRNDQW
jgi:hypothetical protein